MSALWRRLFLCDVDARPLAAVRIALGLVVLLTFVEYLPVLERAHSDAGWLPTDKARALMGWQHWSLLHYISSPTGVLAVGLCGVAAATSMVLGFYSRTSAWICLILLASIHVRNPTLLYGADSLTRLLLFCTALGRCGAVWSIDAMRRAGPRTRYAPVVPIPVWPLRLLQFQMVVIYAGAGLSKVFGETWEGGSALWYGLLNPVYTRFNPEAATLPEFLVPILAGATYFVLVWELLWPLAVVVHPWPRRIALFIGVLVHGGIFAVFQIKWWGIGMLVGYLGFVAPQTYRALELRLVRRQRRDLDARRLWFEYNPDRHAAAADVLRRRDRFGLIRLRPDPERDVARFVDREGTPAPLEAALRLMPALAPLALLARLPGIGPQVRERMRITLALSDPEDRAKPASNG